jgi:type VI secretion system protein ImpL
VKEVVFQFAIQSLPKLPVKVPTVPAPVKQLLPKEQKQPPAEPQPPPSEEQQPPPEGEQPEAAPPVPGAPQPPPRQPTSAQVQQPEQPAAPYWTWQRISLVLTLVLLLVSAGVLLYRWWQKRRKPESEAAEAPKPMESDRLLRIRRRFMSLQPWGKRAAIDDLPTVVVLGPAGSGKTRLVEQDVDWQRQASQFMPSSTDDALLQIYLGPESVVHEVSAPLLEDGSKAARRALWRLWKASFSRRQALVVVALDVRWLKDTPPDEVRRVAHLLRGKINLVSEVCQAPVETRLCMTHMDELEGFVDFARLLRRHGEPLGFELPPGGEERRLDTSMHALEKYLAAGLVSLPLESFERVEAFYSGAGAPFAALGRFISALREGGRLSLPLKLSRVYLSSPLGEARALGTFSVKANVMPAQLRASYRRRHLLQCAALLAVGCLPVLAAYANFHQLLRSAQEQVLRFDRTVKRLQEQGLAVEGPVLEQRGRDAMDAMERLWRATRYWPPLRSSYTGDLAALRQQMANITREYYLRPLLRQCQQQCEQCSSLVPGCQPATSSSTLFTAGAQGGGAICQAESLCRPERMLYLLALVHASREDELGRFVLSSLANHHSPRWSWATALGLNLTHVGSKEEEEWVEAIKLAEPVVGDYVVASDEPWLASKQTPPAVWTRWPFQWLTLESHLTPWQGHFRRLRTLLDEKELNLEGWETLQQERRYLQALLAESKAYGSARLVLDLLNSSEVDVNGKTLAGIESTLQALQWQQSNREQLEAVLRMEEEAYTAIQAVRKMSWAELLTLSDGLFAPSAGNTRLRVDVLGQPFDFRPQEESRRLLRKVIFRIEKSPGGFFEGSTERLEGEESLVPVTKQGLFATEIKPLVDEFKLRLEGSQMTPEQAAERKQFVLAKMEQFAQQYQMSIFGALRGYDFSARQESELRTRLKLLAQPSSDLVYMLRGVATRADLGPMEGDYYESLRNSLAPFKPVVKLMEEDKDGSYVALGPYLLLVSQLHEELSKGKRPAAAAPGGAAAAPAGAPDKAGGDKAGADKAGGALGGEGPQLPEMLSPLGRVALSMMLEEPESYLRKVDEWLDQQGILGEFREPFREPFLVALNLGRAEVESVLDEQWEREWERTLQPLLRRYPFTKGSKEEVEPGELEVLRRKDGAFWTFVSRVVAPVCAEQGTKWTLRGPLKGRLREPEQMLDTLNRLADLSRLLWDEQGKPQPMALQVLPQPLPRARVGESFVTMSYLKCGKTTAFGFNQTPTWQEFPLSWWESAPAAIGLELNTPVSSERDYRAMEVSRSFWSCFRLLESATSMQGRELMWRLLQGQGGQKGVEVRFSVRGEPWSAFRRLSL